MAKLQDTVSLKNEKGQSIVEYILLLAVLTSLGYSVYNGTKFKNFISGNNGLFSKMRMGMGYSYRYGRDLDDSVDYEDSLNFKYQSSKHDTYYNSAEGRSRFFAGTIPYGKN